MALKNITRREGAELRYVKPHGALYNDAVNSAQHADLIAQTIYDIDPALAFMGAPNSAMQRAAQKAGLRFITEGFIDRLYTDAGHLQPRAFAGAVIKDHAARMGQARALASGGPVVTASGKPLKINCFPVIKRPPPRQKIVPHERAHPLYRSLWRFCALPALSGRGL